jgi:hypothetical protein
MQLSNGQVAYNWVTWVRSSADDANWLAGRRTECRPASEAVGSGPCTSNGISELVVFGGNNDAGPVAAFTVGINGGLDRYGHVAWVGDDQADLVGPTSRSLGDRDRYRGRVGESYLLILGDRQAIAWVLREQRMAFPATSRAEVSRLAVGGTSC